MQTFSVLVLSTAHVTQPVAEALNEIFLRGVRPDPLLNHWGSYVVGSPWSEYGWWIWTEVEVEVPPCLRHVLKFAADRGHRWVQFDCDEPIIDELPHWEW